jgi:hypothetical protein
MYHVQHYLALYARCEHALYAEEPEVALAALRQEHPRLRNSGLLRVEGLRMDYDWLYGRVAMALAESAEKDKRRVYLKQARACARRLCNGRIPAFKAIGIVLSAGILNLTPGANPSQVSALLEHGVATAEANGSMLLAESARRWLGETMGGRRGEEIRARSNGWMGEQGVQNPERLAHVVAPGFRRN